MANLRTNNLSGEGGRNAISGSLFFNSSYPTSSDNGLDSLTVPAGSDFAYGTGDFTFEAYVWKSSFASDVRLIFSQTVSGTNYILFGITTSGQVTTVLGHSNTVTSTATIALNSWNHVAVSRASGSVKVFVNGIGTSGSSITTDLNDTTRIPTIGRYTHSTQLAWKGYISNFRITKGEALYTADFTPPTSELTAGDNTVLLCCQDSDNPLQEATGKTLTGFGRYADTSVELVPNGGPTTDVTGWTAYNSSVAYDTGQIKVTRSGGTGFSAYATITNAVIGQRYRVSAQVRSASSRCDLYVTTAVASGTIISIFGTAGETVDLSGFFTATATTLYVFAAIDNDGDIGYYNRVSVKAADYGDAPKLIPPVGVDAGNTFDGAISMNSLDWMYFPTGKTEERGRGRVVIFGENVNTTYLEMSTGGIAQLFGQSNFLISGQHASCSSNTRAVRMNGYSPSTAPIACNVMEYVTIATQSNATDFGDSTRACRYNTGFGSHTRGINANGNTPGAVNTIDYITIANTGDATDFGDLTSFTGTLAGSTSNSTRGLISGYAPGNNHTEYVTIATTGNAQDFGDATVVMQGRKGAASATRALFASGYSQPTFNVINTIDYFTISTLGNAVDFGDLTVATGGAGGTSDSVRAVFMGGFLSPGSTNVIDIVTIATTGNAARFGDMYATQSTADAATSDSHGGLS